MASRAPRLARLRSIDQLLSELHYLLHDEVELFVVVDVEGGCRDLHSHSIHRDVDRVFQVSGEIRLFVVRRTQAFAGPAETGRRSQPFRIYDRGLEAEV